MKTETKDLRAVTASDLKVGDVVRFINIPYYKEDLRLFYSYDTVIGFEPTKSGKSVRVIFKEYGKYHLLGWNTPLENSGAKFWEKTIKERGFKNQ